MPHVHEKTTPETTPFSGEFNGVIRGVISKINHLVLSYMIVEVWYITHYYISINPLTPNDAFRRHN